MGCWFCSFDIDFFSLKNQFSTYKDALPYAGKWYTYTVSPVPLLTTTPQRQIYCRWLVIYSEHTYSLAAIDLSVYVDMQERL